MSFYSGRKKKTGAAAAPKKWQLDQENDHDNDATTSSTTPTSSSAATTTRPVTSGSATGKRKANSMDTSSDTKAAVTSSSSSSGNSMMSCKECGGARDAVLYCQDCHVYMCREDFITTHTPSSSVSVTATDSGKSGHRVRALPGEDLSTLEVMVMHCIVRRYVLGFDLIPR
jgi:hypothetical protein